MPGCRNKTECRENETASEVSDVLGHLITDKGLKPDPTKVEAVKQMQQPSDVEGVQRLNGFVNYLTRFLPGLSDAMGPIRQLTRKDVPWNWSSVQDKALREVK